MDAGCIDTAHLAGMAIVHAIPNTQGFGSHEIPACDADTRAGHGRIDQSHGEFGFNLDPQATDSILDTGKGAIVSDSESVDITDF